MPSIIFHLDINQIDPKQKANVTESLQFDGWFYEFHLSDEQCYDVQAFFHSKFHSKSCWYDNHVLPELWKLCFCMSTFTLLCLKGACGES